MKKIILITAIILSFNIIAEETYSKGQINEFECSPEEMQSIISKSKVKNRIKQTTFSEFSAPYQEASVVEKSGIPASEVTEADKKENDGGLSCFNIDVDKLNGNFWAAIESVEATITGEFGALYGALSDKANELLAQDFCKRVNDTVSSMASTFGESAKKNLEDRIRQEKFGKLIDGESGVDFLMNKQIDHTFKDEKGLLTWRNGGLDKKDFKKSTNKIFSGEIDDLYDDFDDQVDKKAGID